MRLFKCVAFVFALLVVAPATSYAQATLSGTVKDSSAAVLPGVTVEAASPSLIRARTTVTDGSGQFRISELSPGSYTLTFTLPGFGTVKREGITVEGVQVTTINADMKVGTVEETVNVTGQTPVVDVQSARRQQVLAADTISNLPATRGYNALVSLVPSISLNSNAIQLTPTMGIFTSHGGRTNEGRVQLDGLNTGAGLSGGGVSFYVADTNGTQEINFSLSGGLGETEMGGTTVNIIPKSGGNQYAGQFFASGAGEWSQSNNIDDGLKAFGITEPTALHTFDLSGSLGGPFKRDRLWFFGTARTLGSYQEVLGGYANKNAGDPTKWTYDKNPNVKARTATSFNVGLMRLTAQISPRNKVSVYYDHQFRCDGSAKIQNADDACRSATPEWVAEGTATSSPEAHAFYNDGFQRLQQATWTSPVNSRLLLELGVQTFFNRWGAGPAAGEIQNINQVTELATRLNSDGTAAPAGLTYRAVDNVQNNWLMPVTWRASASYVTGSHNMKFGYTAIYNITNATNLYNDTRVNYTLLNTQPTQLTLQIGSWEIADRSRSDAFYVQDQWTRRRLTLQGALRYDHAWSWAPAEHNGWNGPDKFHAQPLTFPRTVGVEGFHDLSPRMGAAYDLFGNGKTSLKFNLGRYPETTANDPPYTSNNPAIRFQRTTARAWSDTNGNYVPDCDLMNPGAQGPATTGSIDTCGVWLSPAFGSSISPTTIDPATLQGWGSRPYDWQLGASVQRQIAPRMSVEVSYNRRWFGNFTVTDNRALSASDFDTYTVIAPQNARLPGGGGYPVTFYDPKRIVTPDNFVTFETSIPGVPARTTYWHGVDVTLSARPQNGLIFQGGTSTGRGVRDFCAVQAALPEIAGTATRTDACAITEPFLTRFQGSASYTIPKIGVLVSTGVQFKPGTLGGGIGSSGTSLNANANVLNSTIAASLGRLPAGQVSPTATRSLNVLRPSEVYGDRISQVDIRIGKTLRFGRTRTLAAMDLYNLFNANPGTAYNATLDNNFPRPTNILLGRFLRFNVTMDF